MTTQQYITPTQQYLLDLYHEYCNDFLTIAFMAEKKEISPETLKSMVDEGRKISLEISAL